MCCCCETSFLPHSSPDGVFWGPFLCPLYLCQPLSWAKSHRRLNLPWPLPVSGGQCSLQLRRTRIPLLTSSLPHTRKSSPFLFSAEVKSPFPNLAFGGCPGFPTICSQNTADLSPVAFFLAVVKAVSRAKLYLCCVLLCDLGQVISPL